MTSVTTPTRIAQRLGQAVDALTFDAPVAHVYNPLGYAFAAHKQYLKRYAFNHPEAILLGMNPGPWGMAQTGVPFGEVDVVQDWLRIDAPIEQPTHVHPKRPIDGFFCKRREVSGRRLWGWARDRFKTPDLFFKQFFVANYCPLMFMESTGRNRTPNKLPQCERQPLFDVCDASLRELVRTLEPRWVIGIGSFAEQRASEALNNCDVLLGRILHPSPASPAANRGWQVQAEQQLCDLGFHLPDN